MTNRTVTGHRVGARGEQTRARLLRALKALLNEYPAHEVMVRDVAEVADCSTATFFNYFDNLGAAFWVLAEQAPADSLEIWARQVRHIAEIETKVKRQQIEVPIS